MAMRDNGRIKRKSDAMWTSTNRLLGGGNHSNNNNHNTSGNPTGNNGKRTTHTRNPNFETDETKLLIKLWGSPRMQKSLVTSHKKQPIIQKLAATMKEHGYFRSPEEINTRLKNLKCFYNRLKKHMCLAGATHPTWKHFDAMDAIMTRPIFGNTLASNEGSFMDSSGGDGGGGGVGAGDDDYSVEYRHENASGNAVAVDDDEGEDSRDLRPEDLLSVETSLVEPVIDDERVVIKEEPIDMESYMAKAFGRASLVTESDGKTIDSEPSKAAMPMLIPRTSWLNGNKEVVIQPKRSGSVICVNPPPPPHASIGSRYPDPMRPAVSRSSSLLTTTAAAAAADTKNNKISLVPTKFLMSPATKAHQQQQQQQVANGGPFSGSAVHHQSAKNFYMPNVSVADSSMPMKVLLVNTMPKPTQVAQQAAGSGAASASCADLRPSVDGDSGRTRRAAGLRMPTTGRRRRKRVTPSNYFQKRLLAQMAAQLVEANLMNRERLALDKQQFEYIQIVMGQLMSLLPALKTAMETFGSRHTEHNNQCNGHDA